MSIIKSLKRLRYKILRRIHYKRDFGSKLKRRHEIFWKSPGLESVGTMQMSPDLDISEWKKVPIWQRLLSDKLNAKLFSSKLDVRVAELYWKGRVLDELNFDILPPDFVVKLSKGTGSASVFVFKNWVNLLNKKKYDPTSLRKFLQHEIDADPSKELLVEELLQDEDPKYNVPRDFKFFIFNGEIAGVQVIDRVKNTSRFYDKDFKVTKQFKYSMRKDRNINPRPACWDEMVSYAKLLSKEYEIFVRLDFYSTPKGAVFGEFTPTPSLGNFYTNYGNDILMKYWNKYTPDKI